jgi:hypothetical protein
MSSYGSNHNESSYLLKDLELGCDRKRDADLEESGAVIGVREWERTPAEHAGGSAT